MEIRFVKRYIKDSAVPGVEKEIRIINFKEGGFSYNIWIDAPLVEEEKEEKIDPGKWVSDPNPKTDIGKGGSGDKKNP